MDTFERAKKLLHQSLKRALIYVLRNRDNTMYGHDAFLDISRLSKVMHYENGAIVDVGANHGQAALRLVREFPEKQIYSFEPHPRTFVELQRNVRRYPNITPVNAALAAQSGEADLFEYGNSALNSLVADSPFVSRFGIPGKSIKVKATR